MGEIPSGWRVGKATELARLSRDGINPGDFPDEEFDHFSIPAFDDGRRPVVEPGSAIKSNKFVVGRESVLLSKLNPRIPRVWLPAVKGDYRAICSTEFLVMLPQGGVPREFLYTLFSSDAFCDVFGTLVTGTSGSHQRVSPKSALAIEVILPPRSMVHQFSDLMRPLLAKVERGQGEGETLSALRDALLPKLISGEVRVRDGADMITEVA